MLDLGCQMAECLLKATELAGRAIEDKEEAPVGGVAQAGEV